LTSLSLFNQSYNGSNSNPSLRNKSYISGDLFYGMLSASVHKRILFFLLFGNLIFYYNSYSQKQADNWYFGNNAGLNFSSGSPVPLFDGQLVCLEGVATISDSVGNLLFYTNGKKVWNRLHQVMPNGTGLNGDSSSTQAAIIVKQPGSDSVFYIFTTDREARSNGLCYSIVNMAGDAGNGAVLQKNTQLLTPVSEKVTAVRHCNRRDVWIITRQFESDKYYSYLLTPSGLAPAPVISSTGNVISGNGNGALGYLKASPDGRKLVAANYYQNYLELMDFNATTGAISNLVKVDALIPHAALPVPRNYGVEFSSNGKWLYVSSRQVPVDGLIFGYVLQFDLSSNDSATITNSLKIIDSVYEDKYAAIQMANNGKIYVSRVDHGELSVINDPMQAGLACNFTRDAVSLGGRIAQHGLPTFFQSYFYELGSGNITHTGSCVRTSIQFTFTRPDLVDSVKWDFGDLPSGSANYSTLFTPVHVFSNSGAYSVRVLAYRKNPSGCSFLIDTIHTSVYAGKVNVNLGNDTSFCSKDTLLLSYPPLVGATYLWSNGSTTPAIKVTTPGQYWLKLRVNGCEDIDTITVSEKALPIFTLGPDTSFCSNLFIVLQPSLSFSGSSHLWSTAATSQSIRVNAPGQYWLRITAATNCVYTDTVEATVAPIPAIDLGSDTTICRGATFNPGVNLANATYVWSTGSAANTITITQEGVYWVDVTQNGCIARDSISVLITDVPVIDLGPDLSFCEGTSLLLNAGNQGSQFLWQDNSTGQTMMVSNPGKFFVKVTTLGCTSSDTIVVTKTLKPRFSLGPDREICDGSSFILSAQNINGSFLWHDGSNAGSFLVTAPGIYYLDVSNVCGFTRDSVVVAKGLCSVKMPNAFSPNNDRVNDVFKALGTEKVSYYQLEIFNRWGQRVFQTTDKREGWDGKLKGSNASSGVYIYVLKYSLLNGGHKVHVEKGTLLLVR
jgi:gliding motility-associated-like protein